MQRFLPIVRVAAGGALLVWAVVVGWNGAVDAADFAAPKPRAMAAAVDLMILAELQHHAAQPTGRTDDADFLRRVSLDLAGRLPTPEETVRFGLDPNRDKRARAIDRLLASDDYAENWARYWRDVIFVDPSEMQARLMAGTFEQWMTGQLKRNRAWDKIATNLLTATGNVETNGATALLVAHSAEPADVAGEVSRIFLGIQINCANCHDHPTDIWKREQFHELAAYFARADFRVRRSGEGLLREVVSVDEAARGGSGDRLLRNPEGILRRLDRNRDGRLSQREADVFPPLAQVFPRLLEFGDTNKDGSLTVDEMKKIPPPPEQAGRRDLEYLMPDLYDPSSAGTPVDPAFFVDGTRLGPGLEDLVRRQSLATAITSAENPWFAQAFVNRMWHEMLGEGFYMPVDDLGPRQTARFPEVLQVLSDGFVASGYDPQWLLRTIALTETYQQQLGNQAAEAETPHEEAIPFASAVPTRLRGDQIYTALTQVLGVSDLPTARGGRARGRYTAAAPRSSFHQLFASDPSTPQEDILGSVPQALFLMNSPLLSDLMRAEGDTFLAELLADFPDDREALNRLYLTVFCRQPSAAEQQRCLDYLRQVSGRGEAYEDLLWSLLNSTEFVTRR